MRLLSRLPVVLAICLVAIALLPVPAQAYCPPYGIELSLKYGPPGTEVTVYGHDFEATRYVDIYYDGTIVAIGQTDDSGAFTLNFTVPEGCRGQYQVLAHVGTTEVHTYFNVRPGLTVSPRKGPAGTTVTVQGRGFSKNEENIELMYYLNGIYETIERKITADALGSWQTSFQIPPSTRGEHKIDAQGAQSKIWDVRETTFRVTAEISLDKSSGIVGDTVTITGSRFSVNEKNIKVLLDGEAVVTGIKASSKGEWETSFQVPGMPAGEYSVTAEGEQTIKEDVGELSFEIKSDIVLSVDGGHVGMELTVTGRGFAANEDVDIMYDGIMVTTAETDARGNFEASFSVPDSRHGERLVAAGYAGANHANTVFTMESDSPPIPSLISPDRGSRLGLMSGATPTFEWSEVSDDSGVRYSLQVATSADFTAPSVIVSVTGLTGVSYTAEETLPNGTYYWRVKAIDGADNESSWTTVRSFRVGLLPMWAFITCIVVAAVLFIALIRALVIRRGIYSDGW